MGKIVTGRITVITSVSVLKICPATAEANGIRSKQLLINKFGEQMCNKYFCTVKVKTSHSRFILIFSYKLDY